MRSALLFALACAAALAVAVAGSARTTSFSCAAVPPSLIRSALHVNVGALAAKQENGELYCTYPVNGVPDAVHVIYTPHATRRYFNSQKPAAFHPHAIPRLGDAAFGYSLGSGRFGQSLVSVLKGSKELTVAGQGVTLLRATALARRLLPRL